MNFQPPDNDDPRDDDQKAQDAERAALPAQQIENMARKLIGAIATEPNGKVEMWPTQYRDTLMRWFAKGYRAALASGATQPSEPEFFTVFALYEGGGEKGWIALPGYSNETEHGVKNLVLEAARKEGYKGTVTGRLQELGWEVRPVYATPPTGEPPLDDKSHPRFIAGYDAGLKDGHADNDKDRSPTGEPLTAPSESVIRNTFESSMHEGFTRREDGGEGRYTMMTVEDEWHSFERGYRAALAAAAAPNPAKWLRCDFCHQLGCAAAAPTESEPVQCMKHDPIYPDEDREEQARRGRYVDGWNACHAAFTGRKP